MSHSIQDMPRLPSSYSTETSPTATSPARGARTEIFSQDTSSSSGFKICATLKKGVAFLKDNAPGILMGVSLALLLTAIGLLGVGIYDIATKSTFSGFMLAGMICNALSWVGFGIATQIGR